jgi:hypothetical protein
MKRKRKNKIRGKASSLPIKIGTPKEKDTLY